MLMIVTTFLLIIVYCYSLWGWGSLFKRIINVHPGNAAVTLLLGLALWVFFGGILNVLSLAYPIALDVIVIFGLILFYLHSRSLLLGIKLDKSQWTYAGALLALILVYIGFVIATQLPPDAYNLHDDFEKYFAHPSRMLQTGTLYGSALSAIGSQTMGAQAFLQGFILSHFSIDMLNGFDSVFCLFLCLVLIGSIGWRQSKTAIISLISVLLVIIIHPQYVNISSLYSGCAFIVALILYISDHENKDDVPYELPNPIGIALFYAALAALKMTFIPFVILHFIFTVFSGIIVTGNLRTALRWGIVLMLWGVLFISPWILLHASNYVSIFGASAKYGLDVAATENLDLLSNSALFYEATYLHYTSLVVCAFLTAIYIFYRMRRTKSCIMKSTFIAIFSAAMSGSILYFLLIIYVGPLHAGYEQALRYSIPILIGSTVALPALLTSYIISDKVVMQENKPLIAIIVITLVFVASFLPTAIKRNQQAIFSGSILSFPILATSEHYLQYNKEVLYGDTGARIRKIQKLIPKNTKVMAWILTPFYLDYSRNEIIDVEMAGLIPPWAKASGVQYIIWEHHGFGTLLSNCKGVEAGESCPIYGVGKAARTALYTSYKFANFLAELSNTAEVIYNDGNIGVLQVDINTIFRP